MLKVAFADFPIGFDTHRNRFVEALSKNFQVLIVDQFEAKLLFYSDFGETHWGFEGLKVYVTGENMLPDFNQCDLAFTPVEHLNNWRAVRLPYYAQVLQSTGNLIRPVDWSPELNRPRFCSFVVSNPRGRERNEFFRRLTRRRNVDSAGRHFNNMGAVVVNKMLLLKECRFSLAFENSRSSGYITEKLIEPLVAGCIPIYWGAPDVSIDFNPKCMVNISDFSDAETAVDYILQLDESPDRRLEILKANPFHGNTPPACTTLDHIRQPLLRLMAESPRPGRRIYRRRRLREHVYGGVITQSILSLGCRLEGFLWKMGWRR